MKLQDIKIVFIDIDGTLCNSRNRITMKTRKSIKKLVSNGILVVITTGRYCKYTADKSMKALASSIIISSNGAEIYDYKQNKSLYVSKLSNDKLKQIWDFSEKFGIGIVFNSGLNRYMNKYLIGAYRNEASLITNFDELVNYDIAQFTFVSDNYEKIEKAGKFIEKLGLDIGNFSESFLEKRSNSLFGIDVLNKNVSKGSAVTKLLEILNIRKEESLCFGDFVNDLDMFDACGYKVAMGNACEQLKKKADFVTLSNNRNGIAYFINKYLKF